LGGDFLPSVGKKCYCEKYLDILRKMKQFTDGNHVKLHIGLQMPLFPSQIPMKAFKWGWAPGKYEQGTVEI
jgi:hypothetical protein